MQAFLVRALFILITVIGLTSCTGYQKVLKKGTPEEKYEAAKKYYNKGDYARAEPLFHDLMTLYFGKREREDIYFYYAYTNYGLSNYLIAGYHFNNFAKSYPLSEKREESTYMAAVCEFHKSLSYELDQSYTLAAINSLQTFINKYPNSSYVEDCNKRIDELRARVLEKVYNAAKLYYQIGEYKAAIVACSNAIEDYPDMINRDELMYIIANSAYIYADNSVEYVQVERYETALKYTSDYFKEFTKENKYFNNVSKIKKELENKLSALESTTKE